MIKGKGNSWKRSAITQGIARFQNLLRHFSKEILIALVLAVVVAIAIEVYKSEAYKGNIAANRKATATILVHDKDGKLLGQGSGIFVNAAGLLVTNYHVVQVQGSDIGKTVAKLPSGAYYLVRGLVGLDKKSDVAVLQFDATETPAVKGLGDSDALLSGQRVIAIGCPLNQENSVSEGVIANPARKLSGLKFIQFTAPISPGSSGGGLFDTDGKAIGITSGTLRDENNTAQNLNLAIPINLIKDAFRGSSRRLREESPDYYYALAQLEEAKRNWDKAIEYYQKALSVDDKYADAYEGLGGVYYEKGEYALEVSNYEKAALIDPKNHDYLHYLGTAYEDIGEYDKADKEYSLALLIRPDDKDTLHDFAILSMSDGDCGQANRLISELKEVDSGLARKLEGLIRRVTCR